MSNKWDKFTSIDGRWYTYWIYYLYLLLKSSIKMESKNKININIGDKNISVDYVVISKQEDGVVASYMPGFDIHYSSPTMEIAQKRGEAMVHNFLTFWIEKQSWKKFVLKIHALGFRSKLHDLTMKNLLNNRPQKAGFSPKIDAYQENIFGEGQTISESNVELAI
jgi:hypothetical protein